jgi:alkanesulfonate monooxygenase SsuD/methylene tetrahydromethanopterin reductase-like flavin-dependent oxidoreductase (luciferase family)
MMRALKFGYCVPMFANPGAAFFRVPAATTLDPAAAVEAAVEAERLGFDSIWTADHLMHGDDGGIMEGWTTLSVIAGKTSRVQLGTIHLAQPFRMPQIVAKMAATLDAISGGRLIFFYDCGWQEPEVRAYGLDWPDEDERIARMDEGLTLIDALWRTEEPFSFDGRYFHTLDSVCRPKPVQQPRPSVWLGESRSQNWNDTICRHADGWNSTPASPKRLAEKLAGIHESCRRIGRDPSELEISLEIQCLIAPTEAEARATALQIADLPASRRGTPRTALVESLRRPSPPRLADAIDDWLVGTPADVMAQIQVYRDLGVSHFMLWFIDYPSLNGPRLFAEQVLPAMRSAT